jgi:hypothetical protein
VNERDIELAIEAGFDGRREWPPMYKKFADLIRADEREACAEVCADLYKQWEDDFANVRVGEDDPEIPNWFDCKLAIEARSET